MGSIVVTWFGAVTLIGLLVLAVGTYRRARSLIVAGCAILLSTFGAWTLGLPGAAAGLVALAFLKPRRGGT